MTNETRARTLADRVIALLDEALNAQVNAILHHPDFQAMEARWRGLAMLVSEASSSYDVRIKVISVSWKELARSMERSTDFDQSTLFELVYSREFGMAGGEPFGILIGDYQLSPINEGGADTISTLTQIGMVSAAAFCPFIAGAGPEALGLERFSELDRVQDFSRLSHDPARARWNHLRSREDARFLGLVAPRVMIRAPREPYLRFRDDGFPFREQIKADGSTFLWANGAFAFAAIIIRNFIQSGWFADIRGVTQNEIDGGMLSSDQLAPYDPGTESNGLSAQVPVEARMNGWQEQQFADFGIVPLSSTYMCANAIFNSNQSMHAPQTYATETARQNARLAAMLQYVLCASRFSHYLKMIMREEIGTLRDADTIQRRLEKWLAEYTIGNEDAQQPLRARYPLRAAGILVHEIPGKPGVYSCTVHLQPHFQLDDVSTSFHLIAETQSPSLRGPSSAQTIQRISA